MKIPTRRGLHLEKIQPIGDRPMSGKPVAVALPIEIDLFVRSLPNRSEWLRQAIAEKYEKEMGASATEA